MVGIMSGKYEPRFKFFSTCCKYYSNILCEYSLFYSPTVKSKMHFLFIFCFLFSVYSLALLPHGLSEKMFKIPH